MAKSYLNKKFIKSNQDLGTIFCVKPMGKAMIILVHDKVDKHLLNFYH
jgi:hypothetical protein